MHQLVAWIADDERGPYIVGIMMDGQAVPMVGSSERASPILRELGMQVDWNQHKNFRFCTFDLSKEELAPDVRKGLDDQSQTRNGVQETGSVPPGGKSNSEESREEDR